MSKKVSNKKDKTEAGNGAEDVQPIQPKARRRIRLKSARDVCRYISSCIRRAEHAGGGETDNVFYKRVMMASMLIKALEVSELEQRLERLEQIAERKHDGLGETYDRPRTSVLH